MTSSLYWVLIEATTSTFNVNINFNQILNASEFRQEEQRQIDTPNKFCSFLTTKMSCNTSSRSSDVGLEPNKETKYEHRRSPSIRSLGKKLRCINISNNVKNTLDDSSSTVTHKLLSEKSSCDSETNFQPISGMCAYYLKHCDARLPGLEETIDTANKIYNHHKPYLKIRNKSYISIDNDGITIKETVPVRRSDGGMPCLTDKSPNHDCMTEIETLYKARRIVYCGVDSLHQRLFMFNYQHGARAENIQIHVIVCKTKDDAKAIAKALKKIFQTIARQNNEVERESKRQHREGLRNKLITQSSQSLQEGNQPHSNNSSKESCTV